VYGLVQGTVAGSAFKHGALFGTGVWSASLVQLPAMKLAPPVWEYPPAELALEVGYHVVYGLGAAAHTRPSTADPDTARTASVSVLSLVTLPRK